MLVPTDREIFNLLSSDCQSDCKSWHKLTSYPESHFLKWVADWQALHPSYNLCPRIGKGQALCFEWKTLELEHVKVLHFSTQSKPYYWFWKNTEALPVENVIQQNFVSEIDKKQIQMRAARAIQMWFKHLLMAIFRTVPFLIVTQISSIRISNRVFYISLVAIIVLSRRPIKPKPTSYNNLLKICIFNIT